MEVFTRIGSLFCRVLEVESSTKATIHFDLGRVKVVANLGPLINEKVMLFIGNQEHSALKKIFIC